ncbi:RNA polymerase I-specific transcription initiation factor RRN3 [Myriangium duriaei CBS 260.36]|uniref:RNA polymerase I-specific transcription initiation factor RRN3 n=1 Tax=Myriangium duriaei CBS 260.36 TaxID=1168546 RepID=A0A9P4J5U7_9PEZI|nr:RNA polymerase I-specific transcription initiation factor RRN3 [Myriangium duriaei CBS 260.36]
MPNTPSPSRPTTLKRDSSHLTPLVGDLATAKRLRVAFSDDVDVRFLEGRTDRTQELVQEEVRIAIDAHLRRGQGNDDSAYEQLRMMFAAAALEENQGDLRPDGYALERPSGAILKQYLAALLRRVGDLKGCSTLLYAILDMNWFGRKEDFISLYAKFLGALASVHPGFLKHIMEKTVRHFVSLPSSYGRISGEPIIRKRQMLASLHSALRYLLQLIPAASDALAEALKAQFPNHRMTNLKDYLAYIRNLFQIASYASELRSDILSLVTERLVKIDVEIQQEVEDLDDDMEEDAMPEDRRQSNYFLDDDTSDDSDAESDSSSDYDDTVEERQLKLLRDKTAKLDAGMDFLFKHYTDTIKSDSSTNELDQLLSLFTTFVLPTYRSRHVQFLAFHFSQLDAEKCARFVSRCLSMIQGHANSSSSAIFGAAYLASFIARGSRAPRSLVQDVVSFLIGRINYLRETYEKTARGPDIGRYSSFYASVQALLYIFCFRWRELLFDSSLHSTIPDDDYDFQASGETFAVKGLKECLTQAIYSRLNPLKVCSPAIVKQYAAIANHLRYMFVYPLLETNKRIRLSSFRTYGGSNQGQGALAKRDTSLSAKLGESHHQLDAFFPFDPYHLPRSQRWLDGDYNEWRGIEGMKYVDDEDDDEEDGEDDAVSDDEDEDDEDEDDEAESDPESDSS